MSREREVQESCRFGVQKCKQIIMDSIPTDGEMFQYEGVEGYFRKLRRQKEAQEYGLTFDPM